MSITELEEQRKTGGGGRIENCRVSNLLRMGEP